MDHDIADTLIFMIGDARDTRQDKTCLYLWHIDYLRDECDEIFTILDFIDEQDRWLRPVDPRRERYGSHHIMDSEKLLRYDILFE